MFDITYLRRYLCDNGKLWDDTFLNQLCVEAEEKIALLVNCIVDRFTLEIFMAVPNYTIPDYVIGIRRVTWKGKKLEYLNPFQAARIFPWTGAYSIEGAFEPNAFARHAFNTAGQFLSAGQQGVTEFYTFQGANREAISFLPYPNEHIGVSGNDLYGEAIETDVIIECYRLPDETHTIPDFVRNQLIKNYVMWKAFLKEGDSQNLKVAQYFEQKFSFGLTVFKSSYNRIFSSKFRVLEQQIGSSYYDLRKQPQLPLNLQYTE